MVVRLDEIVARFGGELAGSPSGSEVLGATKVTRIAPIGESKTGDLTFLANPKYRSQLVSSKASAVILSPLHYDLSACELPAILVKNPYLYYAQVSQWLNPAKLVVPGIHPTAVVEGRVEVSASIGANVWIGADSYVGDGVVIDANCSIGAGVRIGVRTHVHSNVSVYDNCVIGERCILHSGAIIGSDGFGFANADDGSWVKVPQLGRVVIGDDVEVGAGTTIDRGALSDTVIGNGVKLDNQIQIGHNVVIGAHTAMAGCVGVAGSARIGERCTVGGGSIILGHLSLANGVHVSAGTLVSKSILTAGTYSGTVPFMDHANWLKNFSRLRHLDSMAEKVRDLERRLAAVEDSKWESK